MEQKTRGELAVWIFNWFLHLDTGITKIYLTNEKSKMQHGQCLKFLFI